MAAVYHAITESAAAFEKYTLLDDRIRQGKRPEDYKSPQGTSHNSSAEDDNDNNDNHEEAQNDNKIRPR